MISENQALVFARADESSMGEATTVVDTQSLLLDAVTLPAAMGSQGAVPEACNTLYVPPYLQGSVDPAVQAVYQTSVFAQELLGAIVGVLASNWTTNTGLVSADEAAACAEAPVDVGEELDPRATRIRPLIKRFPITDKMINELAHDPAKIYAFGLYLTRACNLRCIFCLSDAERQVPDELTLEKRLQLIDEAKRLGAEQLIISGAGEPLLDRDFWRIVEHAHDGLQMHVLIYSNTTLVTDEIAERLCALENLSVIGKKYSFDTAKSDYLFGGNFTEAVNRGFQRLMDAGMNRSDPTRLGFQCAVLCINMHDIPDLLRYARGHNLFPQINSMFLSGRARENPDLAITKDEYRALYDACRRIDREEFGIEWDAGWNSDNPMIAGCCVRPKYWVMVDDVGSMRACSIDYSATIGDVRNATLEETLRSNAARVLELRNNFQENDCFLCNRPDPANRQQLYQLKELNRDLAR